VIPSIQIFQPLDPRFERLVLREQKGDPKAFPRSVTGNQDQVGVVPVLFDSIAKSVCVTKAAGVKRKLHVYSINIQGQAVPKDR
jgi:hypothetical protein